MAIRDLLAATTALEAEPMPGDPVPERVALVSNTDWAGGSSLAVGPGTPWTIEISDTGIWFESGREGLYWLPHAAIKWVKFRREP